MTPNQIAYRQYLESDHWRALRAEAYRVHGRKCFRCPSRFGLEIHHLRYRHPWTLCTVEDVRPCCWQCHEKEHGIVREIPLPEKRTIEKKHRKIRRSKRHLPPKLERRKEQWRSEQLRYSALMDMVRAGHKLTGKSKKFIKYFRRTGHFSTPAVKGRPNWVNRVGSVLRLGLVKSFFTALINGGSAGISKLNQSVVQVANLFSSCCHSPQFFRAVFLPIMASIPHGNAFTIGSGAGAQGRQVGVANFR